MAEFSKKKYEMGNDYQAIQERTKTLNRQQQTTLVEERNTHYHSIARCAATEANE